MKGFNCRHYKLQHYKVRLLNNECYLLSLIHIYVELFLWEIVNKIVCSENPVKMAYIDKLKEDTDKFKAVCQFTKDRVNHLNETHDEYVSYMGATSNEKHCVDIKRGH